MSVDPAIAWILRASLALLFAAAAWHKLRDSTAFEGTVRDYRVLPGGLASSFAVVLPLVELALALSLLLPRLGAGPALGAAALLGLYSAAIAWNLARGRSSIDCGCLGPSGRAALSPALLVRNALLLGGCLVLAVPQGSRALVWVDACTVVAGSAAAALLFLTSNRLALALPAAELRRPA